MFVPATIFFHHRYLVFHTVCLYINCCGCRVNGISLIVRRQWKGGEEIDKFLVYIFHSINVKNWNKIKYVEKWQYKCARSIEESNDQ